MPIVRRLLQICFGNYQIYRIYQSPELKEVNDLPSAGLRFGVLNSPLECEESQFAEIREIASYFGEDSVVVGAWFNDILSAAVVYWYGARYARERGFWPLKEDEAKCIQLNTVAIVRGQGLAFKLAHYSFGVMASRGFRRLYARIWHSNHPAISVAKKLGWKEIARVIVVIPFGLFRPFRFTFKQR